MVGGAKYLIMNYNFEISGLIASLQYRRMIERYDRKVFFPIKARSRGQFSIASPMTRDAGVNIPVGLQDGRRESVAYDVSGCAVNPTNVSAISDALRACCLLRHSCFLQVGHAASRGIASHLHRYRCLVLPEQSCPAALNGSASADIVYGSDTNEDCN